MSATMGGGSAPGSGALSGFGGAAAGSGSAGAAGTGGAGMEPEIEGGDDLDAGGLDDALSGEAPSGGDMAKGAAGAAAVGTAVPVVSQLMALMAFLEWLKTVFFAMMAAAMNFAQLALGLIVAGAKAVGNAIVGAASWVAGGLASAGAAVAGFLGFGSSAVSIAAVTATLWSAVTTVAVVAVTVVATGLGVALNPALREGSIDDCAPKANAVAASISDAADDDGQSVSAVTEANAKRIYSILAGRGMSDVNIAGVLGNWSAESGIDATGVETIYTEPLEMGPRKLDAEAKGFDVRVIAPEYSAKYPKIIHLGIGLGQWTDTPDSTRHTMLLNYAKARGKNWYDLDLQMEFMMVGDDPLQRGIFEGMVTTPEPSTDAAADRFMRKWEGINGNIGDRQDAAREWLPKMAAWSADADLANSMMAQGGAAITDANAAAITNATDKCAKAANMVAGDNSSAAAAMASFAWPTIDQSRGNDGTPLYKELHELIFPGDIYFQSCDRGVATAVRWSGTDDTYPAGPVSVQIRYLSTSPKWQKVEGWDGKPESLQPGDVLLRSDGTVGHTVMYLGKDLIQQVHGNAAKPDSVIGHASLNTRSPGIGGWSSNPTKGYQTYQVYRSIAPDGPNSQYATITPTSAIPGGAVMTPGSVVASGDYAPPLPGVITSPYGMRMHPVLGYRKMHEGVDYQGSCGAPIKAVNDGVVDEVSYNSASGNRIFVNHGGGIRSGYYHLSGYVAKNGQKVKKGQVIAYVGSTGRSTGCHLHFAVKKDGAYVNPITTLGLPNNLR